MRKLLICLSILVMTPVIGRAGVTASSTVVNTGLTYSTNYDTNLNTFAGSLGSANRIAVQVTYSSVTYASKTFTDGTQSTGSLTVVSTAPLVAAFAINSITVPATSAILGTPATAQFTILASTGLGAGATAQITIISTSGLTSAYLNVIGLNSFNFLNGTQWNTVSTTSGTASNLATAINAMSAYTNVAAAWGGGTSAVVYCTTTVNGSLGYGYSLVSSTPAAMSITTFRGGLNNQYVSVNGNRLYAYVDFTPTSTSSGTAAALAAVVTNIGGIDAAWGGGTSAVVYATATVVGTGGNSYTLGSTVLTSISTSATSFSGGAAPVLLNDSINFNGEIQRNGYLWTDASGTSTGTAISIAAWLDSYASIAANASGSVVYATAAVSGTAANALTLSADPGLTVNSATFVGGQDNAYITINGTRLTIGTDIPAPTASTTTAQLAAAIGTAINANSSLNVLIVSSAPTGTSVVTSTSLFVGAAANYTTVSSTQSKLSFANATMTGGTNSGYSLSTDLITIPGHSFTKALPVLLSTGGATIGPLVNQTTYYVVVIDSNTIGVSSTSAVAQTGAYINLTSSSSQTTAHTLTLAPGPFIQGPASAKWQVSNDAVTWADFSVTSANIGVTTHTFTAVNPSTTVVQDLGNVNYGYMRYNVIGPTQGAVQLKVILNAKD